MHSDSVEAKLLNECFVFVGTHDNGVIPDIVSLVTDDASLV